LVAPQRSPKVLGADGCGVLATGFCTVGCTGVTGLGIGTLLVGFTTGGVILAVGTTGVLVGVVGVLGCIFGTLLVGFTTITNY
jgi:hypothetical protein